jgi:hypothetical protein
MASIFGAGWLAPPLVLLYFAAYEALKQPVKGTVSPE